MELGEWAGGGIIQNLDNRGSDNISSTVMCDLSSDPVAYNKCMKVTPLPTELG